MSDRLTEICRARRAGLAAARRARPLAALDAEIAAAPLPRPFDACLARRAQAEGLGVIAEIKRASPSKGPIRPELDPAALARGYEAAGAAALSVLTEPDFFRGSPADLTAARAATALPVLRKDFMLDPWQIAESRAMGADCVLLILAALGRDQAAELEAAARAYGLAVLIEIHDAGELARAAAMQSPVIGVNARDLKTFRVNLDATEALIRTCPEDRLAVAESGLSRPEDLARMARAGARGALIGEVLMRAPDPAVTLTRLREGLRTSAGTREESAHG